MAFKRSSVRFRLAPPIKSMGQLEKAGPFFSPYFLVVYPRCNLNFFIILVSNAWLENAYRAGKRQHELLRRLSAMISKESRTTLALQNGPSGHPILHL